MEEELKCDTRVPVSLQCYSREIIYRTCYAFTDRAYIWLEPDEQDRIIVALTRKSGVNETGDLKGEFGNALIDFALRAQISKETADIRNALARTALDGSAAK